jgi:hypothetical protein
VLLCDRFDLNSNPIGHIRQRNHIPAGSPIIPIIAIAEAVDDEVFDRRRVSEARHRS